MFWAQVCLVILYMWIPVGFMNILTSMQPTDDKNIQMMYNIASDLKSYCSEHSVSVSSPNSTEVCYLVIGI